MSGTRGNAIISKNKSARVLFQRDKNGRLISVSFNLSTLPGVAWDNNKLTKMQARNLIKWFLGHKYDVNRLPFTMKKRNKIRSKKALRTAIVNGITDNLAALRLLDTYGLLDKRNAKRKRKVHLKSKWTDKQIAEEFMEVYYTSPSYLSIDQKRGVGKIRTLLRRIEKLEKKETIWRRN